MVSNVFSCAATRPSPRPVSPRFLPLSSKHCTCRNVTLVPLITKGIETPIHAQDCQQTHKKNMASRGVVAMRVLYSVLLIHLAAALAAAAADALPSVVTDTPTNLARRHHHHCIHDENLDLFTSTVDPESLASPQRLMPHADSYAQSLIIDEYLDALGLPVQMSRRRALSATGTEASFQPLRIAFDLSKLGSYVLFFSY